MLGMKYHIPPMPCDSGSCTTCAWLGTPSMVLCQWTVSVPERHLQLHQVITSPVSLTVRNSSPVSLTVRNSSPCYANLPGIFWIVKYDSSTVCRCSFICSVTSRLSSCRMRHVLPLPSLPTSTTLLSCKEDLLPNMSTIKRVLIQPPVCFLYTSLEAGLLNSSRSVNNQGQRPSIGRDRPFLASCQSLLNYMQEWGIHAQLSNWQTFHNGKTFVTSVVLLFSSRAATGLAQGK